MPQKQSDPLLRHSGHHALEATVCDPHSQPCQKVSPGPAARTDESWHKSETKPPSVRLPELQGYEVQRATPSLVYAWHEPASGPLERGHVHALRTNLKGSQQKSLLQCPFSMLQ